MIVGGQAGGEQGTSGCLRTGIAPDWTGEMRVYRARKAVMSKRISGDTPRAEILGRKHAPRCHDTNKGIECRRRGFLDWS